MQSIFDKEKEFKFLTCAYFCGKIIKLNNLTNSISERLILWKTQK